MTIRWAARTDPGLKRASNEDAFCARPDLGLFMVADGMGGHAGGEVASKIAVETVEGFVAETATSDSYQTWPFPYDPALGHDANRLRTAFRLANRRIGDESARRLMLRGMATTGSAVLVGDKGTAIAVHVGDSRIYRFRAGRLTRLSQDHSWVEEQVRAGVIDAQAAHQHPWRNVVTRALSGGEDPNVDLFDVDLAVGDKLLLCSDGLFVVVHDAEIASTLGAADDLDALCERLVGAANAAGGPDNVTALALSVDAS